MKNLLILIVPVFLFANALYGQSNDPTLPIDSLTENAADSTLMNNTADYEGGISKFYNYVGYTLANNPPSGFRYKKAKGVVVVSFTVKEDGELDEVKVLKGIEESCDDFALEIVKNSGKWIPAIRNGDPIASTLTLPIRFRQ